MYLYIIIIHLKIATMKTNLISTEKYDYLVSETEEIKPNDWFYNDCLIINRKIHKFDRHHIPCMKLPENSKKIIASNDFSMGLIKLNHPIKWNGYYKI